MLYCLYRWNWFPIHFVRFLPLEVRVITREFVFKNGGGKVCVCVCENNIWWFLTVSVCLFALDKHLNIVTIFFNTNTRIFSLPSSALNFLEFFDNRESATYWKLRSDVTTNTFFLLTVLIIRISGRGISIIFSRYPITYYLYPDNNPRDNRSW